MEIESLLFQLVGDQISCPKYPKFNFIRTVAQQAFEAFYFRSEDKVYRFGRTQEGKYNAKIVYHNRINGLSEQKRV